jgi:sugar lactone lactonase YvrE
MKRRLFIAAMVFGLPVFSAPVEKLDGDFKFTEGPVWVAAKSELLFSDIPANCAFGDTDWKTLYMTCRTGLYRVRLVIPGRKVP